MSDATLSPERLAANAEANFKANLRAVVFCVEATSYERLALWRESASDSDHPVLARPVRWRQQSPGWLIELGTLADMPVMLELSFAVINNALVMFYDSPSVVTDSRMVERWLDANVPARTWGGGRPSRCDAMNFHQCLQAIEEFVTHCMDLVDGDVSPIAREKD